MSYLKQREEKMASEAQESSYEKSYRKRFPKGKDWVEPKPNPFGHCGLNPSSYHGMETIGVSIEKYEELEKKVEELELKLEQREQDYLTVNTFFLSWFFDQYNF